MKIDPGDRPGYCSPGKAGLQASFARIPAIVAIYEAFWSVRRMKMFNGIIRRGKSCKEGNLSKLEETDRTHAVMIALKRGFLEMWLDNPHLPNPG